MDDPVVFGYHLSSSGTAWEDYHFSALTHVGLHSATIDPTSGDIIDDRAWNAPGLGARARNASVKVVLSCSNSGAAANTTLLAQPWRRRTLIENLVDAVRRDQAAGINLDFEQVPPSQRGNLARFANELNEALRADVPLAEISFVVPGVDPSRSYDIRALAAASDYVILKAYDYHWNGSKNAGPVAPLNGDPGVAFSVEAALGAGVPPEKLVLGIPYFGYEWPVESDQPKAACIGPGTMLPYHSARSAALQWIREFDPTSASPYFRYRQGDRWHQVWFDDAESLAAKCDFVRKQGLAGVAVWALSYDGHGELWDTLREAFTAAQAAVR
jgi:spore germination protein YaaH